jgi:alpha-L-fucosidase 2
MCVYPFNQVTPSSPYFKAAVNSMKLRGDASTGWSMGWKINLWARVLDGDHAHDILELALRHHSVAGGGVYYNLYDSHSPFQIDGNFGACAGIAEMVMQSHCDTIQILPALPSVWKEGSMKGLKAVGDFTVNVAWQKNKATRVEIVNNQGQPCMVNCADIAGKTIYVNDVVVEATQLSANTVLVPSKAGDYIVVDMDGTYQPTAINKVAAKAGIAVSGRNVTVSGAKSAKVVDLSGRTLMSTSNATFNVDEAAGKVVLVQVTDEAGKTSTHKVALK